jgi:hypothetical protein
MLGRLGCRRTLSAIVWRVSATSFWRSAWPSAYAAASAEDGGRERRPNETNPLALAEIHVAIVRVHGFIRPCDFVW